MSLILRSLLRDARPLSRAIRRFDHDDWFLEDWPARKIRRTLSPSVYDHPLNGMMDDMSRQMANTFSRMQEMVDDMETLDELVNRLEDRRERTNNHEAVVRRTESGNLQLALNVADFKPEDLKIKLIDDHLVIEAENELSGKDSFRKSHFKRWFKLPDDCKLDEIKSKLTDGDKLVIDLPLNKPIESNARSIPIEVERKQAVESGNESQQQESRQNAEHSDEKRRASARG